jgi:K+ transporter
LKELLLITAVVIAGSLYTMHFRLRSGDSGDIINRSFGPLIATHFLLIFGNGVIMMTGAPYALAAIIVAVKLLIEVTGFADRGSPIIPPEEK